MNCKLFYSVLILIILLNNQHSSGCRKQTLQIFSFLAFLKNCYSFLLWNYSCILILQSSHKPDFMHQRLNMKILTDLAHWPAAKSWCFMLSSQRAGTKWKLLEQPPSVCCLNGVIYSRVLPLCVWCDRCAESKDASVSICTWKLSSLFNNDSSIFIHLV